MRRRVSTADVARHAGVSRTTVSFVLNEREGIAIPAATRERVHAAARLLGYRPNGVARALRSGRTYQIELCVHNVFPAFYAQAIQEFRSHLSGTPYELRIDSSPAWAAGEQEAAGTGTGQWPVDGIIAFDRKLTGTELRNLRALGVPFVSTGAFIHPEVDHVCVDLRAGTLAAVGHLLKSGRRRVAYLTIVGGETDLRHLTYTEVMRNSGLTPEYIVLDRNPGDSDRAVAREHVKEHVRRNGCPEAIFCRNDDFAIGALRGLHQLGVRVPDDVALVGCDGLEDGEYHTPSLSTLLFPFAEVARRAWEILQRRMENPDHPVEHVVLAPELVIRESSERTTAREAGKEQPQ